MKIKDAKERFIKSGTIRNDFIRKEILSSWERSRIYKIPQDKFEVCLRNPRPNFKELQMVVTKKIFGQVMVVEKSGLVLYRMGDDIALNILSNIEEKEIGTTAFSLSIVSQQNEYVEKNEHYINLLEKYNSYTKYNIAESKWIVLFTEQLWSNSEIDDLEKEIIEVYNSVNIANKRQENTLFSNTANSYNIQKEVILSGISREILSVKRQIERVSSSFVNLVLITNCKLTLQAMVQTIIENRSINGDNHSYYMCLAVDMKNSYELEKLNESSIIYVENIHLFPYKLQMDLARHLQQKPKEQCFLWGFYADYDLEKIEETTLPLIFQYLKGTQIELRDIDTRSVDIKSISQSYIAMNYPDLSVDPLFYVSLNTVKQAKSLESLLNYLKFKCDMNVQSKFLSVDKYEFKEMRQTVAYTEDKGKAEEILNSYKLEDIEREQIERALQANEYQLAKTAKVLGIGRTTLYRKIKHFKIQTLKHR